MSLALAQKEWSYKVEAITGSHNLLSAIFESQGYTPPPPPPLPPRPRRQKPVKAKRRRIPLPEVINAPRCTVAKIQARVAQYYGIPAEEMTSPSRLREHVHPRQIAMLVAREVTDYSLPALGKFFGGRDHTTVLHSIREAEARVAEHPALAAIVNMLRAEFRPVEVEE